MNVDRSIRKPRTSEYDSHTHLLVPSNGSVVVIDRAFALQGISKPGNGLWLGVFAPDNVPVVLQKQADQWGDIIARLPEAAERISNRLIQIRKGTLGTRVFIGEEYDILTKGKSTRGFELGIISQDEITVEHFVRQDAHPLLGRLMHLEIPLG